MFRASLLTLGLALVLCSGCKKDPNTVEYWASELKGAHGADKVRVLEALRHSPRLDAAILPLLHEQLASEKSHQVKAALAKDIGQVGDPSSVEPLSAATDLGAGSSEAKAMNREIAAALGNCGPRATLALLTLLKSSDGFVQLDAVESLGNLRAKEAVDPLLAVVQDEHNDPFLVRKAIVALGRTGDTRAVPALVRMLFTDRSRTSFYPESSFALFQLGTPAADALLKVLNGSDPAFAAWAHDNHLPDAVVLSKTAQVLGDFDDPRAEAPLVARLGYKTDDEASTLFVRMMAANALGRLRSKEGVKALAKMVDESDPVVRTEYVRALTLAGGPDVAVALERSAGLGHWLAREQAILSLGLVAQDPAVFGKLAKAEPAATAAECKKYPDEEECKQAALLTQTRQKAIEKYAEPAKAAAQCKEAAACWEKKLEDANDNVRKRAALALGRSGSPAAAAVLAAHAGEKDPETRLVIIEEAAWLVDHVAGARAQAQAALPAIDKQVEAERGNGDYAKVDEDLKRLSIRLHRS